MLPKTSHPLARLIILCSLLLSGCHWWDGKDVHVEKGRVDLTAWDGRKPISLYGDWMIFWDERLDLAQVKQRMTDPSRLTYAATGKSFQELDSKRSNKGQATYALLIHLKGQPLDIVLGDFRSIPNGFFSSVCTNSKGESREIANLGHVGEILSKPEDAAGLQRRFDLPVWKDSPQECLISVYFRNDFETWSGVWFGGRLQQSVYHYYSMIGVNWYLVIIIGLLSYVMFIHVSYWIRSPHERSHLYIVICAIGGLIPTVMFAEIRPLFWNFFDIDLLPNRWEWRFHIFGRCLMLIGAIGFVRSMFKPKSTSKIMLGSQLVLIAILGFVLTAKVQRIENVLLLINLIGQVGGFLTFYHCILCWLNRESDSRKILIGIAAWVGLNSYNAYVIFKVPSQLPIIDLLGFAFFLLCLSQIVASRYAALSKTNSLLLAEVQEKERARTLFFQNSSHELRTPLNGIIGYLDLLQRNHTEILNEKTQDYLRKTARLAESLKNQVNTVLDLAKSKRGELKLQNSIIAINQFKEDCDSLAEGLLLRHPHSRYESFLSDPNQSQRFTNDREKLFAIIRNLIGNAFKFTRPGTENCVRLTLSLEGGFLTLVIEDQGIGIPVEQKDKIFDEFVQVTGDARRAYEGTGLGLAMVRDFVQLMGGHIVVDSELGKGSRFTVRIPEQGAVTLEAETQVLSSHAFESAEKRTVTQLTKALPDARTGSDFERQHTILVVDDHAVNCEILAEILKADGHITDTAEGGAEALVKIRAMIPDLVLLDMMMPEISGEDVLRAMRMDETLKTIPVILITARASEEDRVFGLTLGADDYIAKPIIAEEVRLRVHNLLLRLDQVEKVQDLEQRDRLAQLGELFSDLSHEVKNIYQGSDIYDALAPEPTQRLIRLLRIAEREEETLQELVIGKSPDGYNSSRNSLFPIDKNLDPARQKHFRLLRSHFMLTTINDDRLAELWSYVVQLEDEQILSIENMLNLMRSYSQVCSSQQRGQELFTSVLNYGQTLQKRSCDISQALEDVSKLCITRLRRADCRIDNKTSKTLLEMGSSDLQQILLNLILNGIDAVSPLAKEERWISIQGELIDQSYTLRISNGGPRLDTALIPKLFERGFTTKGVKGSGIGLYVSRRLAIKSGASLGVDASLPHTCFVLVIPAERRLEKSA